MVPVVSNGNMVITHHVGIQEVTDPGEEEAAVMGWETEAGLPSQRLA